MKYRTLSSPTQSLHSFGDRPPMPQGDRTVVHTDCGHTDWISAKNLDLCLLAVCSCILSLLCHQPVGAVNAQAVTAPTGMNPSAMPVRIDFLVKAGLLTTSKQDLTVIRDEET